MMQAEDTVPLQHVSDTLLSAFRRAAFRRIEGGSFQGVKDATASGDLEPLLNALSHVAKHSPSRLMRAILDWHNSILQGAPRGGTEPQLQRRSVLTALVFWQTVHWLLGPAPGLPVTGVLSSALEQLAFDWVYQNARWSHSLQVMELPGVAEARRQVTEHVTDVLGLLSWRRFPVITARFVRELEARVKAESTLSRAELVALCQALHRLHIGLSGQDELGASTMFLKSLNPLHWSPVRKKSEVRHALAELLTRVLASAVGCALAPTEGGYARQWFDAVSTVRDDVHSWVRLKEKKHMAVGYPLVTVLLCLGDNRALFESFMEKNLHKALKDVKTRRTALECLHLLLQFYLRSKGRLWHFDTMWGRIQATMLRLVVYLRKGASVIEPVHRELLVAICTLAAEIHPEFALSHLVGELLRPEPPLGDHTVVGLRALLAVVEGTAALQAAKVLQPGPASTVSNAEIAAARQAALHRWCRGEPLLQEYSTKVAQQLPALTDQLGQIMNMCHAVYGQMSGAHSMSSQSTLLMNRSFSEATGVRERAATTAAMRWALRFVPLVMHEDWAGRRLCDTLPEYAAHSDDAVREQATAAALRCVRAVPEMRAGLVRGMASFVLQLPADQRSLQHDCLLQLVRMLGVWETAVRSGDDDAVEAALEAAEAAAAAEVGGEAGGSVRGGGAASGGAGRFGFAERRKEEAAEAAELENMLLVRLEAVGLCTLCRASGDTRQAAFELLAAVRHLHRALVAKDAAAGVDMQGAQQGGQRPVTYLWDVIELDGDAIAEQAVAECVDWRDGPLCAGMPVSAGSVGRGARHNPEEGGVTSAGGPTLSSLPTDGLAWACSIALLALRASHLCPHAVQLARKQMMAHLQQLTGSNFSEPPHVDLDTERFVGWRAAAFFLCASTPDHDDSAHSTIHLSRAMFQALVPLLRAGGAQSDAVQVAAAMALGHTHPAAVELLFEEVGSIDDWLSGGAQGGERGARERSPGLGFGERSKAAGARGRRDAVRLAGVVRMLTDAAQPGPELRRTCSHYVSFLTAAARQLHPLHHRVGSSGGGPSSPTEVLFGLDELLHLRYAICLVTSAVAAEAVKVAPTQFSAAFRAQLFQLLAPWCDDSELWRHEQERTAALAKVKDVSERASLEAELARGAEGVHWAALRARACLLMGAPFDEEARKPNGRVLKWIASLLDAAPNPRLHPGTGSTPWANYAALGRLALRHFLQADAAAAAAAPLSTYSLGTTGLMGVCVDLCYSADTRVSNGVFSVLVEVFLTTKAAYDVAALLSLLLYKVGDQEGETREEALLMLRCVAIVEWGNVRGGGGAPSATPPAPVMGDLSDSYSSFQYALSLRLAREHPEITERLAEEMMQRNLQDRQLTARQQFLMCMRPWFDNLSFVKLRESDVIARLLQSLYYVTLRNNDAHPAVMETLWSAIASKVQNVPPVLDFLISKGMEEYTTAANLEVYLGVARPVTLFLARESPQHTIDQLVYEITQRVYEDHPTPLPSQSSLPAAPLHLPEVIFVEDGFGEVAAEVTRRRWQRKGETSAYTPGDASTSASVSEVKAVAISRPVSVSSSLEGLESSGRWYMPDAGGSRDSPGDGDQPSGLTLSRADLALVLLAEVAYEHDEDFRSHLPTLFHVAVVSMDCVEGVVRRHTQQLLINLVHSLAVKPLERAQAEATGTSTSREHLTASALIRYLQSMKGHTMWAKEELRLGGARIASAAALGTLADSLVHCMVFDSQLRAQWGGLACAWAAECDNQHLACRSHQVYRALAPTMTTDAFRQLLHSLERILTSASSHTLVHALEATLTLQQMVASLTPTQLILFPQLLWAAVALLRTPFAHIHAEALRLFTSLVASLPPHHPAAQHLLLAACPAKQGEGNGRGAAIPPPPLYLLLLRGLTCDVTATAALRALLQVGMMQSCDALFGWSAQLHVTVLVCALPWLWVELGRGGTGAGSSGPTVVHGGSGTHGRSSQGSRDEAVTSIGGGGEVLAEALAEAYHTASCLMQMCQQAQLRDLARELACLAVACDACLKGDGPPPHPTATLRALAQPLCAAFFPQHARRAFGQLLILLQTMVSPAHGEAILRLLAAMLEHPTVAAVCRHSDGRLFAPVAKLVESPLAEHALRVLELLLSHSGHTDDADATNNGNRNVQEVWGRGHELWPAAEAPGAAVRMLAAVRESFTAPS